MKLYELPRSTEGIPIYDGEDTVIKFYHIDGAYSYCEAFNGAGENLGIVRLSASTPIEKFEDGYRIVYEPNPRPEGEL